MAKVCLFRPGSADTVDPELLGVRSSRLAELARLGLPVPVGFTLTTEVCGEFLAASTKSPGLLLETSQRALVALTPFLSASYGLGERPLVLSVSVSPRTALPGLMDTVLNLGLTDGTCEALSRSSGRPSFALDCYARCLENFGTIVEGIDRHRFEDVRTRLTKQSQDSGQPATSEDALRQLVDAFKEVFVSEQRQPFPQDPWVQLERTLERGVLSWTLPRAQRYRSLHAMPPECGLALQVCAMVFGNRNEHSGTGRCYTRNPITGERAPSGEYLAQSQGDDLVAGLRKPGPLGDLAAALPQTAAHLAKLAATTEAHFRDVQDIEFAVESGVLTILETRPAKRTTEASLAVAVALAREGIISPSDALLRINPMDIERMLHPSLDPRAHRQVVTRGLPASPGAAAGRLVFQSLDAELWASRGESVILVKDETTPEDVAGMHVSKGFLTTRGGMTSHTAVVARQMGKPCVAGCTRARILANQKALEIGAYVLVEGDWLTLDGATGDVILGKVATSEPGLSEDLRQLIDWAVSHQSLQVRANADTPADARVARMFGARGIGLCRTEHMFFDEDRLPLVRQMILARGQDERDRALQALLPHQQNDFALMLATMTGLPVTIRLLDPPLHEFLPHRREDLTRLSAQIGIPEGELRDRIEHMSEQNPMLGHRGCRLGISHPAIYEMQVKAICLAAAQVKREGLDPQPEIMVPLVGLAKELAWLRRRLEALSRRVLEDAGCADLAIPFGTMIEVPRAALTADELAHHADFFSFGTNDLTQTTFGFSRDDSANFLRAYEREGILASDPFATLDVQGVGALLDMSIARGRSTKPDLKVGICGEHAGDPVSIRFLNQLKLDYLSCSPYRLPIAQLAAAQASLEG